MLKKTVAEQTKELCKGNKVCTDAIAECIEDGKLPLDNKKGGDAWSDSNPYKEESSSTVSALDSQSKTKKTDGSGSSSSEGSSSSSSEEASATLDQALDNPGKKKTPLDEAKDLIDKVNTAESTDETGNEGSSESENAEGEGSTNKGLSGATHKGLSGGGSHGGSGSHKGLNGGSHKGLDGHSGTD